MSVIDKEYEAKMGLGPHTEKQGKKMLGAEAIIASLEAEGVDTVFGYPGGQAIKIYDALYDSKKINHVLARHEQGATHEADGYARATGKTGVVIVTSGPGATNTVTGIATAYMDSVPMVVITGQVPRSVIGTDAFQESDIVGITMPIVKHSYLLQSCDDMTKTFREAFYIANSGRPGPVLIDIPSDLAGSEMVFEYPEDVLIPSYKPTVKGNIRQIRQACEMMKEARRPILYIGGGIIASHSEEELLAVAEKLQIPVVSTLMGKGAFPASNPLSLGLVGMHGSKFANYAVTNSDLLIAVGARFSDRVTGKLADFAPDAKVIHIDVDPAEIGKNRIPQIPIVGDAKVVLGGINDQLEQTGYEPCTKEWLAQIEEWRSRHPFYSPGVSTPAGSISPEGSLDLLSGLLDPENSIVTTEVGQHQMWAAQHIKIQFARQWISSGGLGTMGFGLPAAMGAQLARPKSRVISISGDGGFKMTGSELFTIASYKLPVTAIVFNNSGLGMIRQLQTVQFNKRFTSCEMPGYVDFVKYGEAFGVAGEHVDTPEALAAAVEKAMQLDAPYIIEVALDPKNMVQPMVTPGLGIGDFVKFKEQ